MHNPIACNVFMDARTNFQPIVCHVEEIGEWRGASPSWMHWNFGSPSLDQRISWLCFNQVTLGHAFGKEVLLTLSLSGQKAARSLMFLHGRNMAFLFVWASMKLLWVLCPRSGGFLCFNFSRAALYCDYLPLFWQL